MQLYLLFSRIIALIHSPRHCAFASPGTAKVVTNGLQSTQHFIIWIRQSSRHCFLLTNSVPSRFSYCFSAFSVVFFLWFIFWKVGASLSNSFRIFSTGDARWATGVKIKWKKIKSFYLRFYYRESQRWHEFRWFVMKENRFSSKQRNFLFYFFWWSQIFVWNTITLKTRNDLTNQMCSSNLNITRTVGFKKEAVRELI